MADRGKAARAVRDPRGEILDPLTDFLRDEAAGGVVLFVAAALAMVWANSPLSDSYESLWSTELRIGIGDVAISEDLRHWVNDGLMALFFFVVGLEIKRELVTGELNERRTAALPVLAAVGGAVLPAIIFVAVIAGGQGAGGWAIPMATDIAFAVGVLALLGDRVSSGVKLFMLAIAVVDDIVAIAVIAAVYTDDLSLPWLAVAGLGILAIVALRRLGAANPLAYVPAGLVIWVAVHESGVHATIAGVVLGLLTPARPVGGREVLRELEHRLHPWTSLAVVPLFALANAGIALGGGVLSDAAESRVTWAIVIGLVLGKLAGIGGAAALGLRIGFGELPEGVRRGQVWGVAALGGVGFTVSLFIAQLAFEESALQEEAKVGIFAGSLVAAALGSFLLASVTRRTMSDGERAGPR
jgi:NhaA family Na+:H+ antiporter